MIPGTMSQRQPYREMLCVQDDPERVRPEGYNSHYDFNIFSKGNASDLTRNRDLQDLDAFNIMAEVGRM
jgi:hypothetical protein